MLQADSARRAGLPLVVASGRLDVQRSLELGRTGVAVVLEKPFSQRDVLDALSDALAPSRGSGWRHLMASEVGSDALPAIIDEVRAILVDRALEQSRGNKTRAAGLLGVARQNVQNFLKRRPRADTE